VVVYYVVGYECVGDVWLFYGGVFGDVLFDVGLG